MTKQIRMSWCRFDNAARTLAGRIRKSGIKISAVYGNPRGGLCLAVRLSHLLNVPLITDTSKADKDCLFVDDIIDTGEQAGDFARTNWKIAVLYANMQCHWRPDFYVFKKPLNSWITFPWEKK